MFKKNALCFLMIFLSGCSLIPEKNLSYLNNESKHVIEFDFKLENIPEQCNDSFDIHYYGKETFTRDKYFAGFQCGNESMKSFTYDKSIHKLPKNVNMLVSYNAEKKVLKVQTKNEKYIKSFYSKRTLNMQMMFLGKYLVKSLPADHFS